MKAEVNNRFNYEISRNPSFQVLSREGNVVEVHFKGQTFKVESLDYCLRTRSFELAIEGHIFNVRLNDELDASIQLIRQKADPSSGNRIVTAPIPGIIKNLHKQEGDPVLADELILVLEAMKMENTIQAPVDGDKIEYHVRPGERIGKGQPIFTIVQHSSDT